MVLIDTVTTSTAPQGSTSLTYAHTCNGSNRILLVGVTLDFRSNGGVNVSGVTYNGSAMTIIGSAIVVSGGIWSAMYYLINPSTGANNIVVSVGGAGNAGISSCSASYTGALQSGQPESSASSSTVTFVGSGQFLITCNVTTVNQNDMVVGYSASTANTSTTLIATGGYLGSPVVIESTSGTINAGSLFMASSIGDTPVGSGVNLSPGTYAISFLWNNGGSHGGSVFAAVIIRSALSLPYTPSDSIMNGAYRFAQLNAGTVPATAPVITVRQKTSPFAVISSILNYIKTSIIGTVFPVLDNEQSDPIFFRIYNNFGGVKGVADAINVWITTWDPNGSSAMSAVASQLWLHLQQSGFGEGSSGGGLYTQYFGTDQAVGGASTNGYFPDYSSNGIPNLPEIRSASNFPGAGFIEIKSYMLPKLGSVGQLNVFVIVVNYQYIL